jgi:hypothetical protein
MLLLLFSVSLGECLNLMRHFKYVLYMFHCCTVLSSSSSVYIYCENAISNLDGTYEFETKDYCPQNLSLQTIVAKLKAESEREGGSIPWKKYLAEAAETLRLDTSETDFSQPPPDTDKLYMAIGQQDVIEVAHPSPLAGSDGPATHRCVCGCSRHYLI